MNGVWFVTKYWATKGIQQRSDVAYPPDVYVYFGQPGRIPIQCKIGRDAFKSRKDAVENVRKKARAKLASLNKKRDRIEALLSGLS